MSYYVLYRKIQKKTPTKYTVSRIRFRLSQKMNNFPNNTLNTSTDPFHEKHNNILVQKQL